ncbi:putative lipoprotein [Hyphomonas neptunium ATCC 15444]|uniref:Putative lipoprotein n=2 Tax=Hyphomonas TaxID=85 RepID=Q0BWV9_HYPNA|nr:MULTISPECIES: PEGA domain-containing protein [Hyphomonas]ABI75610.1 putative lipoprotein [Hyphomonas neptunium ATCC 15444]
MLKLFMLLPMAVAMSACATVTRGTSEAFVVETTPSGASVATSLGLSCSPTPCVLPKVKRESEFTVTISKEGYETTTHNVTHQMSGGGGAGMAGNVILGGGIGAILDANNGSTQELVPNPLKVTLQPLKSAGSATTDSKAEVEAFIESQETAPSS